MFVVSGGEGPRLLCEVGVSFLLLRVLAFVFAVACEARACSFVGLCRRKLILM